jgi:drug/metabolite transporter (DMT)-like permease
MSDTRTPDLTARRWRLWLALTTVYLVWGSTYLAIRVMVETIPPLLGSGVRFLLAGAVLYPVLLARRGWAGVRVPARQVGASALVGCLFLAGGTGLVTAAERDVPSGLAAVLVAAMPLVVVLLRRLAGEAVPRATTHTHVNPVVAVLLGWLILSERVTLASLAGAALIVGAVVAVVRHETAPEPEPEPETVP